MFSKGFQDSLIKKILKSSVINSLVTDQKIIFKNVIFDINVSFNIVYVTLVFSDIQSTDSWY